VVVGVTVGVTTGVTTGVEVLKAVSNGAAIEVLVTTEGTAGSVDLTTGEVLVVFKTGNGSDDN